MEEVTPPAVPPPPDGETPVYHRTITGHYNEEACPAAGAAGQSFGRNCPGYAPGARRVNTPDPFLVAQKLLARRPSGPNNAYFKPAGDQLNILAAAWIQAMVVSFELSLRRGMRLGRGVGEGKGEGVGVFRRGLAKVLATPFETARLRFFARGQTSARTLRVLCSG